MSFPDSNKEQPLPAEEPDEAAATSGEREVAVGTLVRLRKPHACGRFRWTITRIGADVGLRCVHCGRRILLPRAEFQRRLAVVEPPG